MKIKKYEFVGDREVVDITVSNGTYISGHSLHHNCKNCWSLWTLPDKTTPKVYKMSELAGGYSDRKNPIATLLSTHPNCRDVLTFLSPGFGFENGKIKYKGQGWNEFQAQRSGLK